MLFKAKISLKDEISKYIGVKWNYDNHIDCEFVISMVNINEGKYYTACSCWILIESFLENLNSGRIKIIEDVSH